MLWWPPAHWPPTTLPHCSNSNFTSSAVAKATDITILMEYRWYSARSFTDLPQSFFGDCLSSIAEPEHCISGDRIHNRAILDQPSPTRCMVRIISYFIVKAGGGVRTSTGEATFTKKCTGPGIGRWKNKLLSTATSYSIHHLDIAV